MPFGPYNSFKDCVAKNGDKSSPEGFCAWLEHQITGQWPGQNSSQMPEEAWSIYREAYAESMSKSTKTVEEAEPDANESGLSAVRNKGWSFSRIGWVREYAAPSMRMVSGVKVFAVGTWTDSSGSTREWTEADVDGLVEAFNARVPENVPLKAGHTPDSFNIKIAEKLNIPVELVTGDLGKGQVAIGRMATLERRGHLLLASFERVPEPIADLIESGLYSAVSLEIEDGVGGFASAITAVALLGAEEPAVDEATLDRALVFGGKRDKAHVLTFSSDDRTLNDEFNVLSQKMSEIIRGMRGAPVFRALLSTLRERFDQLTKKKGEHQSTDNPPEKQKSSQEDEMLLKLTKQKFQEEPPMEEANAMMEALMAIAESLGLGEGATVEDILAAITAMKEAPPAGEMSKEFSKFQDELKKRDTKIAGLEHKDRVHGYMEQTRLFSAIPNKTPEKMAAELADIEENQGKEKAGEMLKTYQDLNRMGQAAMKATGTSLKGKGESDYEQKVTEYMKENPNVSRGDAQKAVMRAHPDLRYQHLSETQVVEKSSGDEDED